MDKEQRLYELLFHYNYHNKKWSCFTRDDKRNYFNGTKPYSPIGVGSNVDKAYDNFIEKRENNE